MLYIPQLKCIISCSFVILVLECWNLFLGPLNLICWPWAFPYERICSWHCLCLNMWWKETILLYVSMFVLWKSVRSPARRPTMENNMVKNRTAALGYKKPPVLHQVHQYAYIYKHTHLLLHVTGQNCAFFVTYQVCSTMCNSKIGEPCLTMIIEFLY